MKKFFGLSLFLFSLTVAADVGLIGPDGKVFLLYKGKKSLINLRSCGSATILGTSVLEARQNCLGSEKPFSEAYLRRLIRLSVFNSDDSQLKPLTDQSVASYKKINQADLESLESFSDELDKINRFTERYGEGQSDVARAEVLRNHLRNSEYVTSILKVITNQVDSVMNAVSSRNDFIIVKSNEKTDRFFPNVIKRSIELVYTSAKIPCGLKGTIGERINLCSILPYRSFWAKYGYYGDIDGQAYLVTRSLDLKEVWYSSFDSNVLWSDRISDGATFSVADVMCSTLSNYLGLGRIGWRLPNIEETKWGFMAKLPNPKGPYWNWGSGYSDVSAVRCVAEIKQ